MAVPHLDQFELAKQWKMSHRTLERWRSEGHGPAYLKLGGRVLYRVEDVETFERAQLRLRSDSVTPCHAAAPPRRLTARPPADRRAC